MPRPACLAQEIVDFVDHSTLDSSFEHEVVFVIHTAKQTSAHGLVSILSVRGFECECGRDSGTWSCTARRNCVLTLSQLEPMCSRLLMAIEEFDCELAGFRVLTGKLAEATHSGAFYDAKDAELAEVLGQLFSLDDVSDFELDEELSAITASCPAIARFARLHDAMDLYHAAHYAEAHAIFRQLCDETPTEQHLLLPLMAHCCFYLKNFAESATLFEHAIALRSETDNGVRERLELTVNLGACYARLKQFDKEAAAYRSVFIENPRHAAAHYNMACHKSRAGDIDASLMHLRMAIVVSRELALQAKTDDDLNGIRSQSEFRALLGMR